MQLLPLALPLLKPGDDIAGAIATAADLQSGDIVAVSSKAAAICEGALIDLQSLTISDEAKKWTAKLHRAHPDPAFRQAVLEECARWNGTILSECPNAMLTELRPDGMKCGTVLIANAGLDRSNTPEGSAIGWPREPVSTVCALREKLEQYCGGHIGVLLTDSCCRPRRLGVTALALTVAGFEPFTSHIGTPDLYGKEMHMTVEAVADQLATAANAVMGNTAECIPAVIIREHPAELSEYCGWVEGVDEEEDLFQKI